MANFNTHVVAAAFVSGVVCSTAVSLEWLSITQATNLWLVGVIGGILPDIDSDNSHAVSLLFSALALFACFITALFFIGEPLWQLWATLTAVFVLVRFPLSWTFKEWTIHRGAYHSLLAAASFTVYGAALGVHVFQTSLGVAWAGGIMLGLGYVTHLVLDEIYAVDFSGLAIKRSFGSAIKPIDKDAYLPNILFILTASLAWYFTPKPDTEFWHELLSIPWRDVLLGVSAPIEN